MYYIITCTNDGRLGIATQAVLEDPGELAVPVGNVGTSPTGQLLDHLAQGHHNYHATLTL